MTTVAIIGGKLQGTESVALARLAGIHSILIDKNPNCPASTMADEFVCGDICGDEAANRRADDAVIEALIRADFVLPAMENQAVLDACVSICQGKNLRLAFDPDAYQISSSKILSDKLFHENNIPAPAYYPDCQGPYIIKPTGESGSAGVTKVSTHEEATAFLDEKAKETGKSQADIRQEWIIEEYLTGPSYSIEVIGNGREYRTYGITQIHMDDVYDCCKVTAPCPISDEQEMEFRRMGKKLGELVGLKGIMDVEVIDDEGVLKVLEIDARIPSQTPLAVYYSTGVNLLEELADITLNGEFKARTSQRITPDADKDSINLIDMDRRWVCYEHYVKEGTEISQVGEHIMSDAKPLTMLRNCGRCEKCKECGPCDMVIWELPGVHIPRFSDSKGIGGLDEGDFRGIFITSADSWEELETKRKKVCL